MTNKSEDDGALILHPPPPLRQCSVLRVFKACTERKEELVVVTPGNQTQDLLH